MADAIKKVILELELNAEGAVVGINRTEKELQDLGKTTQAVSKQASTMNKTFQNTAGSAGIAGAATAEFGRLISDLPYGIQAVTNNISQLGSMFALLVSSAGGVRKALKAMWTTMMGPAGVLIAFQAVVAAVDYFSRSTKKATEEVNRYNEAISALKPRIADMEALASVIESGKNSIVEQRYAIEQLKKLGYDPLNESLKEFKDRYIEIITLQATKDVFAERISSIVKERLELEDEIKRLRESFTDDETFIEKVLGMINIPIKEARQAIQAMKIELSPQALAELDTNLQDELSRYSDIVKQIVKETAKGSSETFKDATLTGKKVFDLILGESLWAEYRTDAEKFAGNALKEIADKSTDELKAYVESKGERNWFVDTFGVSQETIQNTLDQVQQGLNAAFSLIDAQMGREIALEERKTIALNDQLRNRLRNEELTAEARDKINQEIARNEAQLVEKQNEIEKKRFNLNKAQGIANAVVNTATAVTKVLPNIPLATFIGAVGAAQIATIASQAFVPTPSPTPSLTAQGNGQGGISPTFNVVGATAQNQIAAAVSTAIANTPVRSYVVSGDVTTAQQLERNIIQGASI